MKCVILNGNLDHIVRVTDEEAKILVNRHFSNYDWQYCSKNLWKKHVRDPE